MSYPMNEFVTDRKRPVQTSEEWISSSASAARTAGHKAGHEVSTILERGRDASISARKWMRGEADEIHAVMQRHPYATVLAGISAGVLLGLLASLRPIGRSV